MTSCEPDTSVTGDDDGDDDSDDDANDLESTPKPLTPLPKSHLPEAVDDALSSTGFSFLVCQIHSAGRGGQARQGAQLH